MAYATKNTEGKKEETGYRMQETAEEDLKPKKDKKTKALYGRYEEVPNALPEDKAWEKHQGQKTKGAYRTIDEIELKAKKSYDMVINNPIKFIKQDIANKAKKEQELMRLQEEEESSSSSSSSAEGEGEGDYEKPTKVKQKLEKIRAHKTPMELVK